MTRVSGRAGRVGRRWAALPNAFAVAGAFFLAVFGVPALVLAYAVHRGLERGEIEVTALRADAMGVIDAHLHGLWAMLAKFAYQAGEDTALRWPREMEEAARNFQFVIAITLLAGLVASVSALWLRTDERWQELVWLAAAALAVVPGFVVTPWLPMAAPSVVLFAVAIGMHFVLRRDLASRGAAAIAPHAGKAVEAGTAVASTVTGMAAEGLKAARERLPEARTRAAALGRRGGELALPVAGSGLRRFRRMLGDVEPTPIVHRELFILRPDGPAIVLAEWQAYAAGSGDLRLEGALEHTDPLTGEVPLTQAAWTAHPEGERVTFHHAEGMIAATLTDAATTVRMREIAAALGAGLQSGDGQFAESPGAVAQGGLPGRR